MIEIRRFAPAQDFPSVLALYESVNWATYTSDPARLERALSKSHEVLVAAVGGDIVGLVRTVSDGEVICYIQDLLVKPEHQRAGVGRALIGEIFERYPVRQIVLMTDNEPRQRDFYQALGFQLISEGLNAFVRLS
jgi:ribosomal protein S18 acetylase RimI-like enzyme